MFLVIEVEKKDFRDKKIIKARFLRTNEPDIRNGNGNLAAVFEEGTGEKIFLTKELEKKSFFLFPFKDEFGECIFWETESEQEGEEGFLKGCESIASKPVVPQRTRMGIMVEEGELVQMILLEERRRTSLLTG